MVKNKKIIDLVNGLQWLFNVNGFEREIIFEKENEKGKGAEIIYEENYQRLTIKIYPLFFEESLDFQRKIILHELCHCLTMPQKLLSCDLNDGLLVTINQIKTENERATSRIENILDGLLQGRLKYAKEAYEKYLEKPKNKNGKS